MAFITFVLIRAMFLNSTEADFLLAEMKILTTACSWTSEKWAHLKNDDTVFLRISVGRFGDMEALAMDDDTLIESLMVSS